MANQLYYSICKPCFKTPKISVGGGQIHTKYDICENPFPTSLNFKSWIKSSFIDKSAAFLIQLMQNILL